jgi:hypothetical protein
MPAPSLGTILDRIGQIQAPLPAMAAILLGVAVLAAVVLPTWLVVQHVNTIAHEGAHALVGSSTGWKINGIRLERNGNGETTRSSADSFGDVMTSAAGYVGPSAFGFGAAKLISVGHIIAVLWLALLLLAIMLVMIRNPFGFCSVVITGLMIYFVARYAAVGTQTVAAYVITWFLLLSGLRVVLDHNVDAKDAKNLARKTHLPRMLWVGMWLAGTAAALLAGGSLLV